MNVKSVKLIFENDEEIMFKSLDVQILSLQDITTSYNCIIDGDLVERHYVHDVLIIIKNQGNDYSRYTTTLYDDTYTPFDRIMQIPDIVQIVIYFNAEVPKRFYVKYKGNEHNELQKSYLYSDGALCIKIGE